MRLILRVVATAVAVAVAALLVPGIVVAGPSVGAKALTLVVVAAVIGLVNGFVKPLVTTLTGCLVVLTLGLFLLVINALMLQFAAWIAQQLGFGFYVDGFWPALFGSIIISLVSGALSGVLGADRQS